MSVHESGLILVERHDQPPTRIAAAAVNPLDQAKVDECLGRGGPGGEIQFIVNVPRDARVTGDALAAVSGKAAIGTMADLARALRDDDDLSAHVYKETAYVERGLQQHSAVTNMVILDRGRYRLERGARKAVTVVVANDYELTADRVRTLVQIFAEFDLIALSNPNVQTPSPQAHSAASSASVEIVGWSELFKKLNYAWT